LKDPNKSIKEVGLYISFHKKIRRAVRVCSAADERALASWSPKRRWALATDEFAGAVA